MPFGHLDGAANVADVSEGLSLPRGTGQTVAAAQKRNSRFLIQPAIFLKVGRSEAGQNRQVEESAGRGTEPASLSAQEGETCNDL